MGGLARWTSVLGVVAVLATPSQGVAAGPGIPNLSYSPAELYQPIGFIDAQVGAPRGHGSMAMIDGYLAVVFSRDSGEGDGGFAFFDISDPRNPSLVFAKDDAETEDIREAHGWGITRVSGKTYAVLQASFGVQFWDFSDVTKPRLANYLKLPGITASDYLTGAWYTFWQGRYVYVAGSSNGLYIVDAADPENPKLVDDPTRPNPIPQSALGNFRTGPVYAVGNLLVITGMSEKGYATLDISDPTAPRLLAANLNTDKLYSGMLNGNLLLGASEDGRLSVHDIADPSLITLLGNSEDIGGKGGYVTLQDGFAFVGASANLAKVDISNPAQPKVAATAVTGRSGRDDDFTTPLGNLVLDSDDHGTGSGLIVHQIAPDTTPPVVNMVEPKPGALRQSPLSRIGFTFTDQIDFDSVDASSVVVRSASGQVISGVFSYQTNILSFHPATALEPDTTYQISLPAGGIRDLAQNPLASTFASTFSTGRVLSTPECVLSLPGAAEIGATLNFSVTSSASGPLTYSWDFGDGTPKTPASSSGSAQHGFATPGHFNVIASVSDANGVVTSCVAPQTIHRPLLPGRAERSSNVVIDPDGSRAWVANADHDSVTAISLSDGKKVYETPTAGRPRALALAPDGTLWVAADGGAALQIHDRSSGETLGTLQLPRGSRPISLVMNPAYNTAYVALYATNKLLEIDVAARSLLRELDVTAPRGLAVSADGKRIYVTRFLSAEDHAEVAVVDGDSFSVAHSERLGLDPGPDSESSGRGVLNYLRSITLSPDGHDAWIPAKKDNIERGWNRDSETLTFESTVRAVVARLPLDGSGEDPSTRIDLNDRSLPSAAVLSPLGDMVFVATEGSNTVEALDAYSGETISGVDGTPLAPDGLSLSPDGKLLLVHGFTSRKLAVYDVSGVIESGSNQFELLFSVDTTSSEPLSPEVLLGKQIFYNARDARMSRDSYLSCANCHLDGEHDGRTWDFTDRGEGFRNTTTLLGKNGIGQGRVHWSGNFDEIQDFEHDIRDAFKGLGFMGEAGFLAGRDTPLGTPKAGVSPELDALAAYVSSLERVDASPFKTESGRLTADAQAGEAIFARAGCNDCHSGPDFENSAQGELYDVGTLTVRSGLRLWEPLAGIDTPTLKGLWATAPYLHDGSAKTLREVVERAKQSGKHGEVADLSEQEVDQLVAYLLSLDDTAPDPLEPTDPELGAEGGGCGCRSAGGTPSQVPWPLLLPLALWWSVRRRNAAWASRVRAA